MMQVSTALKVLAGTKYRRPVENRSPVRWLTGLAVLLAFSAQGALAKGHLEKEFGRPYGRNKGQTLSLVESSGQILRMGWGERLLEEWKREFYVLKATGELEVYESDNHDSLKQVFELGRNLTKVTKKGEDLDSVYLTVRGEPDDEFSYQELRLKFERDQSKWASAFLKFKSLKLCGWGERKAGWFGSYTEEFYELCDELSGQGGWVLTLRAYNSYAKYLESCTGKYVEPKQTWLKLSDVELVDDTCTKLKVTLKTGKSLELRFVRSKKPKYTPFKDGSEWDEAIDEAIQESDVEPPKNYEAAAEKESNAATGVNYKMLGVGVGFLAAAKLLEVGKLVMGRRRLARRTSPVLLRLLAEIQQQKRSELTS